MSKNHSKRRNAGIVYELLLRQVSAGLVDDSVGSSRAAMGIIRRFYKPGTEIHREFRLFSSLLKTTVSSRDVAQQIVSESRRASQRIDAAKLEEEKTALLTEISHRVKDPMLMHRNLDDYRIMATIGTLMSDWRSLSESTVVRRAQYESSVVDWLVSQKQPVRELESHVDSRIDPLVIRIMTEKYESRFSKDLSEGQRNLIREFLGSDSGQMTETLTSLRKSALKKMSDLVGDSDVDQLKLAEVRTIVEGVDPSSASESDLATLMSASDLIEEIGS